MEFSRLFQNRGNGMELSSSDALVPAARLERVRPRGQGILSPWCLPFHHTGKCEYTIARGKKRVKGRQGRPLFCVCVSAQSSTVTRPSGPTEMLMPSCTKSRNSSPRQSTTGILQSVHTSARIAPEAASESMGLEKSMQAGCLS